MSDTIDDFRALNQYHKEQRAAGREAAPEALDAAGVRYTVHNGGAHIIVQHAGKRVDFWPGPGRWRDYKAGKRGYDIESLIDYLKGQGK
ncbi:hypothetical protein DD235_02245 [Corticimicrobacter populi]|uniref:Uncharacterized protein n=2 Tax=Corticimicrobacter populi TaxID=2175229 RepID=A0A2V1K443_9BURK|nr:hypothetical protein DD235_02245 [Corticimicrobacter populi]